MAGQLQSKRQPQLVARSTMLSGPRHGEGIAVLENHAMRLGIDHLIVCGKHRTCSSSSAACVSAPRAGPLG